MGSVDEKLRRGFSLVAAANGDGDTLGVALLALHGALEDHLDETLRRLPEITPEDLQLLDDPGYGWLARANLALNYGLITPEQRQAILEVNRQRQGFAHGNPFVGSQRGVELYANLVADLCGTRPTAPHAARPAPSRPTPAAAPAAAAPRRARASEGTTISASTSWNDRAVLRRTRRADPLPDALPVRLVIGAAGLLVLLLAGWWLFNREPPAETPVPPNGPLPPAITPVATTPPPTPTPEPRTGRIARLGGAAGWLREQPSFNAPTLPPPLTDGTPLTLLDREPVDAEGTTWLAVSVLGYEGWVPQNNVDLDAAAPPTPSPAVTVAPAAAGP